MRHVICRTGWGLVCTALVAVSVPASGQQRARPGAATDRKELSEPVYRVAQAPIQNAAAAVGHPLDPALKIARDGLTRFDETIKDYTCTLVKRERIGGRLLPHEYMYCKFRQKPFSVYMYFRAPEENKGREAIYVDGGNDGKLLGHGTTAFQRALGIVKLDPTGPFAMKNNRYPITEAGMRNLVYRLIQVGEEDRKFGECDVKFFKGTKVDNQVCTCIQVVHPVPRKNFRFHIARIFIDDERQIPIRFESYDWPVKQAREKNPPRPVLLEEYTYTDIKLNVGLTDADFDPKNPNYNYP